jgi:WD40 repeat protein
VTGATLRDVPIMQRSLMCAAYSPDGSMLALGTRRGDVLILETAFYTVQMEFHAHRDYVYSLVWMPDGERLVTASGDETLRIWDPRRARR